MTEELISTNKYGLRDVFLLNWLLFFIPAILGGRDLLMVFWNTIATIDQIGATGGSSGDSYRLVIYLIEAIISVIVPVIFLILGLIRQLRLNKELRNYQESLTKLAKLNLWLLNIFGVVTLLFSMTRMFFKLSLPFAIGSIQLIVYSLSLLAIFVMYLGERRRK